MITTPSPTFRLGGVTAGIIAIILFAAVVAPSAHCQYVERRGGESTLRGSITDINDAGISIQSELGADHFIPWDRVRDVYDPDRARELDRWRDTATQLWRARVRVERHDYALAEPLLERLFEQYRGRDHGTALLVAEGLLRCRLARGAQDLALLPALEVMRLRRAGVSTMAFAQMPAVFDAQSGLCTLLPPYWIDSPGLARVLNEASQYTGFGDEVVRAVARLYAESLRRHLHPQSEPLINLTDAAQLPEHPGVRLLADLLLLSDAQAALRQEARDRLLRTLRRQPAFAQAWLRFFIGLSLINESGVVRRERGMVSMLHVPALYAADQKYLAGIALRIVAEALEQHNDRTAAESLRSELTSRFPYHPIRFTPSDRLGLVDSSRTQEGEGAGSG